MILTRYLYPKHNVIYSLYVSLALVDKHQANFWAYELYYSGFRTETIELLFKIYDDYYKSEPIKPFIQKKFSKIFEEWKRDMQPEIISTIIENLIRREPDLLKFQEKIPWISFDTNTNTKYLQKHIFIVLDLSPKEYETILADYTKGWKLPGIVCKYKCFQDEKYTIHDYDNWLYSSAGSPIWRTRIKKYNGKIDENAKTVKFSSEESEEEFMNWYYMEPDEQPLEIQEAWIGISGYTK